MPATHAAARSRAAAAPPRPAAARTSSPAAASSSTPTAPTRSTAAINLALALGLPGRPGSGYGTLTGQGNGQGGREHGQKADQLPGYRQDHRPGGAGPRRRGVGRGPRRDLPGPGVPARANSWTRSAPPAGRAPCWCTAPTSSSRRRTPRTCASGSPRSTCSWSATSSLRDRAAGRRRAARDRSGPRRRAP